MTLTEQKKEAQADLDEYFRMLEKKPGMAFTLKLTGGDGKHRGTELYSNKPAGKDLRFT